MEPPTLEDQLVYKLSLLPSGTWADQQRAARVIVTDLKALIRQEIAEEDAERRAGLHGVVHDDQI